jgi:hypothetical protein
MKRPKERGMEIGERIAVLESTVKGGFETAQRDRTESREQAARDLGEIKGILIAHGEKDIRDFKEVNKRVDDHESFIQKAAGFKMAIVMLWIVVMGILGVVGYHVVLSGK